MGYSRNVVSTEADLVNLIGHIRSFDDWLVKILPSTQQRKLWISPKDNYSQNFPSEACGEKDMKTKGCKSTITGTQTYLEIINREIRSLQSTDFLYLESITTPGTYNKSSTIKLVRTSDPHDNYKSVSFCSRRPDLVLYD